MKTVLAPNAPWPKWETKTEPKSKKRQSAWRNPPPKLNLDGDLDYFAEAREQISKTKLAVQSRVRDVTTGRFKGSNRLSG
jgi:hypothetical protein